MGAVQVPIATVVTAASSSLCSHAIAATTPSAAVLVMAVPWSGLGEWLDHRQRAPRASKRPHSSRAATRSPAGVRPPSLQSRRRARGRGCGCCSTAAAAAASMAQMSRTISKVGVRANAGRWWRHHSPMTAPPPAAAAQVQKPCGRAVLRSRVHRPRTQRWTERSGSSCGGTGDRSRRRVVRAQSKQQHSVSHPPRPLSTCVHHPWRASELVHGCAHVCLR